MISNRKIGLMNKKGRCGVTRAKQWWVSAATAQARRFTGIPSRYHHSRIFLHQRNATRVKCRSRRWNVSQQPFSLMDSDQKREQQRQHTRGCDGHPGFHGKCRRDFRTSTASWTPASCTTAIACSAAVGGTTASSSACGTGGR